MKYILFCLFFITTCFANAPLPADQAFQFSATAKDYQTILVQFKIAPNYYLYQKHFHFKVIKPEHVTLGNPLYPSDTEKLQTQLGTFDVYSNNLTIPIPIINAAEKNIILQAQYQGCSKNGYCYPPTTKLVDINLAGNYFQPAKILKMDIAPIEQNISHNVFENLLNGHSFFAMIIAFFIVGILLSLTPCVLPMIPILSSIIVGKEHKHAFFLSLFYVLGMSITYAIAGILFGVLGSNVQMIFQQPWIIVCFSLLFVLMALSLFGLFQLQLPETLRSKVANVSHHQKSGTYIGAFLMGVLSTLILSPCVTPPLVAALGFISQSGNATLGGVALFAMGIGMGAPLLLIGALGTRVLPKSGDWMNTIKNIMGLFLLAVAIFMLARILPGIISMMLWAALCIGAGIYFGGLKKIIGVLFFMYGVLLFVNAYQGNTNPLRPFSVFEKTHLPSLSFQSVQSVSDVNAALNAAGNKIVMLDFSADWCIACKELETITFQHAAVQTQMKKMILLRADITKNSADNQMLMQHYDVIAPPTILFFKNGEEIKNARVVGFVNSDKFLRIINRIK